MVDTSGSKSRFRSHACTDADRLAHYVDLRAPVLPDWRFVLLCARSELHYLQNIRHHAPRCEAGPSGDEDWRYVFHSQLLHRFYHAEF